MKRIDEVNLKCIKYKEAKITRIPIALSHLSIKLNGTTYWDIVLRFLSSMFSKAPEQSAETSVPVTWSLELLNSRNFSIGSQEWIKVSQFAGGWSHPSDTVFSLCSNKGLGDQSNLLLQTPCWKDKGFLFACAVNEYRWQLWILLAQNISSKQQCFWTSSKSLIL